MNDLLTFYPTICNFSQSFQFSNAKMKIVIFVDFQIFIFFNSLQKNNTILVPKVSSNLIWVLEVLVTLDEVSIFILLFHVF